MTAIKLILVGIIVALVVFVVTRTIQLFRDKDRKHIVNPPCPRCLSLWHTECWDYDGSHD